MALTRLCPFCLEAAVECICPEEEPVPAIPGMRQIPDAQAEMERLAEARKQPPAGVVLTGIACPVCGRQVPVECGDVTGLDLAGMLAIAMAKADQAHVTCDAVEHGPVSVSAADADGAEKYREQAAAAPFPGLQTRFGR